MEFGSIVPLLRMFDIPATRAFYNDYLGFGVDFEHRFEPELPLYMQVWMPNGSHHMYRFDIANAKRNGLWDKLPALFDKPPIPAGWKRVVENMPLQQAALPAQPPR